jgi:hypothetical protein
LCSFWARKCVVVINKLNENNVQHSTTEITNGKYPPSHLHIAWKMQRMIEKGDLFFFLFLPVVMMTPFLFS